MLIIGQQAGPGDRKLPLSNEDPFGGRSKALANLDWIGFRTRDFPGRRPRHDFQAAVAYGAYKTESRELAALRPDDVAREPSVVGTAGAGAASLGRTGHNPRRSVALEGGESFGKR
jgi:hypothetical protein